MKHYKAYCFDLDGTVYRGNEGVESAVAFIHHLQKQGIEPFYVTNNSSKTRQQLQDTLKSVGVEAPLEHIYSSALTTAKYVKLHYSKSKVRVMGADGIRQAIEAEGIEIMDSEADVFIMGIDRSLTYKTLADVCILLQNGAKFIATNGDIKYPTERGFVPGNGSFARLVGEVSGVEPLYIGKPSPVMLEVIAHEFNFTKEDMVMIGDNYETDIQCGIQFGIDTIHVNTGVTPTDVVKQQPQPATYYVDNLYELIK